MIVLEMYPHIFGKVTKGQTGNNLKFSFPPPLILFHALSLNPANYGKQMQIGFHPELLLYSLIDEICSNFKFGDIGINKQY